jgi:hypothetical protein
MITAAEYARRIKVSGAHIRQLCVSGRIQGAQRLGRDWLIPDPPVVLPPRRIKKARTQAGKAFHAS